ncbi:unnamed protein product [Effrenium voratum]|uniref:Uncharacterized protein n=1 Tax=Effrenium voratum TaxID=2562239 RepID=A0AA36I4P6_9DINO|nr:unnamed protein product [Effrenium voratum]
MMVNMHRHQTSWHSQSHVCLHHAWRRPGQKGFCVQSEAQSLGQLDCSWMCCKASWNLCAIRLSQWPGLSESHLSNRMVLPAGSGGPWAKEPAGYATRRKVVQSLVFHAGHWLISPPPEFQGRFGARAKGDGMTWHLIWVCGCFDPGSFGSGSYFQRGDVSFAKSGPGACRCRSGCCLCGAHGDFCSIGVRQLGFLEIWHVP